MNRAQYIITGTDTDVGKTIFASALISALKAHYWKPIQAGTEDGTDTKTVSQLSNVPDHHIMKEAYCLTTPCSPHLAAEIDQVIIDVNALQPPIIDNVLIIEGAGGAMVPVNRTTCYADIFADWQIPTIIVARTTLGTINHSLSTIEILRNRNVPIHGIAFIGDEVSDSQNTICSMGGVKSLGRLPVINPLNADALLQAFHDNFDIKDFI